MGNHFAGKAMGVAAEVALKMRTNQKAIDILDQICKPWQGCDAEFEAEDPENQGHDHPDYTFYTDPNGPLGILITEAFGKKGKDYKYKNNGNMDAFEKAQEEWGCGPCRKFDDRYDFH
jgi:hypothetical protein